MRRRYCRAFSIVHVQTIPVVCSCGWTANTAAVAGLCTGRKIKSKQKMEEGLPCLFVLVRSCSFAFGRLFERLEHDRSDCDHEWPAKTLMEVVRPNYSRRFILCPNTVKEEACRDRPEINVAVLYRTARPRFLPLLRYRDAKRPTNAGETYFILARVDLDRWLVSGYSTSPFYQYGIIARR